MRTTLSGEFLGNYVTIVQERRYFNRSNSVETGPFRSYDGSMRMVRSCGLGDLPPGCVPCVSGMP